MDKKELIIMGIIVVIVIIGASILFAPNSNAKDVTIDVLNKGAIGENGTIYVKLSDSEKTALGNKTVNVKLVNAKNEVVYEKSVKTHATGVAIVKLNNVSAGNYDLKVSFGGDENYTAGNISQKLTVKEGYVEEELENSTLIEDTLAQDQDTSTSSSQSSSSQTSSSSSQQSTSQSEPTTVTVDSDVYFDEFGTEVLPTYDENGTAVM